MAQVAHRLEAKARTQDIEIDENVTFSDLFLSEAVLSGLHAAGFRRPSPIQLAAIPLGRCGLDLVVQAKSGTGKTCVLAVVALEAVTAASPAPQVLVVAPTREVAVQVAQVVSTLAVNMPGLRTAAFIGGTKLADDRARLRKCQVVVGTPGRLAQLVSLGHLRLDCVRLLVLDEADRLLEGNFLSPMLDLARSLPLNKQVLCLSATYSDAAAAQAESIMRTPSHVRLGRESPALLGVNQLVRRLLPAATPPLRQAAKEAELLKVLSSVTFNQCLVFSGSQLRAESLCHRLKAEGWPAAYLTAAQCQTERLAALKALCRHKCRVLVATDLAARGLDSPHVNLVINVDLPYDPPTYLHRAGRAGRYGSHGAAVTLVCGPEEWYGVRAIATLANVKLLLMGKGWASNLATHTVKGRRRPAVENKEKAEENEEEKQDQKEPGENDAKNSENEKKAGEVKQEKCEEEDSETRDRKKGKKGAGKLKDEDGIMTLEEVEHLTEEEARAWLKTHKPYRKKGDKREQEHQENGVSEGEEKSKSVLKDKESLSNHVNGEGKNGVDVQNGGEENGVVREKKMKTTSEEENGAAREKKKKKSEEENGAVREKKVKKRKKKAAVNHQHDTSDSDDDEEEEEEDQEKENRCRSQKEENKRHRHRNIEKKVKKEAVNHQHDTSDSDDDKEEEESDEEKENRCRSQKEENKRHRPRNIEKKAKKKAVIHQHDTSDSSDDEEEEEEGESKENRCRSQKEENKRHRHRNTHDTQENEQEKTNDEDTEKNKAEEMENKTLAMSFVSRLWQRPPAVTMSYSQLLSDCTSQYATPTPPDASMRIPPWPVQVEPTEQEMAALSKHLSGMKVEVEKRRKALDGVRIDARAVLSAMMEGKDGGEVIEELTHQVAHMSPQHTVSAPQEGSIDTFSSSSSSEYPTSDDTRARKKSLSTTSSRNHTTISSTDTKETSSSSHLKKHKAQAVECKNAPLIPSDVSKRHVSPSNGLILPSPSTRDNRQPSEQATPLSPNEKHLPTATGMSSQAVPLTPNGEHLQTATGTSNQAAPLKPHGEHLQTATGTSNQTASLTPNGERLQSATGTSKEAAPLTPNGEHLQGTTGTRPKETKGGKQQNDQEGDKDKTKDRETCKNKKKNKPAADAYSGYGEWVTVEKEDEKKHEDQSQAYAEPGQGYEGYDQAYQTYNEGYDNYNQWYTNYNHWNQDYNQDYDQENQNYKEDYAQHNTQTYNQDFEDYNQYNQSYYQGYNQNYNHQYSGAFTHFATPHSYTQGLHTHKYIESACKFASMMEYVSTMGRVSMHVAQDYHSRRRNKQPQKQSQQERDSTASQTS